MITITNKFDYLNIYYTNYIDCSYQKLYTQCAKISHSLLNKQYRVKNQFIILRKRIQHIIFTSFIFFSSNVKSLQLFYKVVLNSKQQPIFYFFHKVIIQRIHMTQLPSNHIYDYIIIGGGISGLQSLQILSQQTKNIILLESQSFQAGRILSENLVSLPGANSINWIQQNKDKLRNVFIEKGATWIEERHIYLLKICKDLGIQLRQQNSEGSNLYLFKDNSIKVEDLKKNPKFGPSIEHFLAKVDHLAQLYNKHVLSPNENKFRANRMLSQYDSKLVNQFLEQNCLTQEAKQLIEDFFQHTECVSCDENSMHEVLTKHARSNDIGILREFLGDYSQYGHQPSYLINKGTFELISKFTEMLEKQMGLSQNKFMLYNQKVLVVDNRKQVCSVTSINTKTNKVSVYRAKKILSSVPLAVSRSLTFTNISKAKRYILDNQLRTSCLKSFLIVKKPFWRKFASGDALFSSQHLVNMCHDISPPDLSCGIMVFFHSGKKYDQWQSRFKQESNEYEAKKKYIIGLTCKLFQVSEEEKKLYLEDALFYISTFMDIYDIRSGFQSCTSPGTFSAILKYGEGIDAFYRDENNVYFIGSEYSKQYASYIEGAIRVARQKCYALIGKADQFLSTPEIAQNKFINNQQIKSKL